MRTSSSSGIDSSIGETANRIIRNTIAASAIDTYSPCCTEGRTSSFRRAPTRWAIIGVSAHQYSSKPCINRHPKEEPMVTPARWYVSYRPVIRISKNVIKYRATCVMRIGMTIFAIINGFFFKGNALFIINHPLF